MGANPRVPQQPPEFGPGQWRVTPGGKPRRMRAYIIAAAIVVVLIVVLLVLLVVRFGAKAPATGPKSKPIPPRSAIHPVLPRF